MNLTIEMPFEAYRGFVNEFDPSSVEFGVLAGGCVERRRRKGPSGVVVQITCKTKEAQLLLNTAVHACPEAANAIAEALSVASRAK
jgi:hypothetical protein